MGSREPCAAIAGPPQYNVSTDQGQSRPIFNTAGESLLHFDSVLDDIVKRYGSFNTIPFSLRDKCLETCHVDCFPWITISPNLLQGKQLCAESPLLPNDNNGRSRIWDDAEAKGPHFSRSY
jgi:hypothetical protein